MLARKHHTNPSIASIRIFIFANQVLIHLQMFIPNVFLDHGFRHNSVLTQAGQPKYSYIGTYNVHCCSLHDRYLIIMITNFGHAMDIEIL